jgi:hypothetical protein
VPATTDDTGEIESFHAALPKEHSLFGLFIVLLLKKTVIF